MLLSDFDLYQATSSKKKNVDYLENNGPIECFYNPWLDKGFYFWAKYIEHAHWWGNEHYKGKYYIFKARINSAKAKIFDIYNDTDEKCYLMEFMEEQGIGIVQAAIIFLRKHSPSFNYNVIVAHTPNCGAPEEPICFVSNHKSTFTYRKPAIQVCVTDKTIIETYRCIYPEKSYQIKYV